MLRLMFVGPCIIVITEE